MNEQKTIARIKCGLFAPLGVIAAVLAVACSTGERTVNDAEIERARTTLQPFKKELKSALLEGLEGGPVEAISVCREAAPEIALRHSSGGIEMGRTSHRLRNPGNKPADWVKPLLDAYANGGTESHRAVVLGDGRIGYVEPIYVQKPCLMCHGETVAPVIADEIARDYPEDAAVGFKEGDFRGLFWVTMPHDGEGQ